MGGQPRRRCLGALRALCWTAGSRVSTDLALNLFGKILKFFLGAVPSPWLDQRHGLSLAMMDPHHPSGWWPSPHKWRDPPLLAHQATSKGGHLHRDAGPRCD